MPYLIFLVAMMVFPCTGYSQWGSDGCQPVGPGQNVIVNPFQQPAPPPVPPNFGITSRDGPLFSRQEKYTYNGHDVHKNMAHKLVQGSPTVPDDSKLPWLVTVSKTQEDKLKARALLSSLQSKFRIQNYLEGEWYTKDRNGKLIYENGLTVCTPTGSVVAKYVSAEDGLKDLIKLPDIFDPLDLLNLLNRIRNPKPPTPMPGPTPPSPAPSPDLITIPVWVIVGAGLVLWMILGGKRQ